MLKRSRRLALVLLASILVVSFSFSMSVQPASASTQTVTQSVRFGDYDWGYGRINVDLSRQGTGWIYKVTFYYEIWTYTGFPVSAHIDSLRLGIDTCNAAHTQWFHQLYSGIVMLTGAVNQYFEVGGTHVITKYHDGMQYTVYYGTVTFGPATNPYYGECINAYMQWGAHNVNILYFETLVSMNYAELANDQNALVMDYFRDLYSNAYQIAYFPNAYFYANPPWG